MQSCRTLQIRNVPTTPYVRLNRSGCRRRVRTNFMGEQVDLYSNGVFDFKQSKTVKKGSKLPIDDDAKLLMLDDKNEPREVNIKDLIQGKKVVIFGLPGAYTSICSSKHVPEYNKRADELMQQGVDRIICLSVNDPWVMKEWAKNLNVETNRVMMLADGEGLFHSRLGLLQHMPGLGIRSIRYSMLVDDGIIKVLNIEEAGGKSYKTSGPGHMLEDIANLKKSSA